MRRGKVEYSTRRMNREKKHKNKNRENDRESKRHRENPPGEDVEMRFKCHGGVEIKVSQNLK